MIIKITILTLFSVALFSCKSPGPNSIQTKFERILQDTTNNYRAQWDLEQLDHYNNICKAIGLNRLYDGVDSFEVRAWRQVSVFGMATDEEIYSLKIVDSTISLTFYRVYCTPENDHENYSLNPFTHPKIDSFFAVSKTFPIKIADSINLQGLWSLKTQSALNIPDSIGFTDGTVTSIELASKLKYKLIKHRQAYSYYKKTKINDIIIYMDEYDKIIGLFKSNKICDRNR